MFCLFTYTDHKSISEFDEKSNKCATVGYFVNCYLLCDDEKLRRGRDIVFDELKMFSKINNETDYNAIFENLSTIKI